MPPIRVKIPRRQDAPAFLQLADLVYAKHLADGPDSPIRGELSTRWNAVGPKLATARRLHNEAKELMRLAEEKYQNRDLILTEADPVVKQSRDILLGFYGKANARALGAHGFEVDDTPRPPKAPKA